MVGCDIYILYLIQGLPIKNCLSGSMLNPLIAHAHIPRTDAHDRDEIRFEPRKAATEKEAKAGTAAHAHHHTSQAAGRRVGHSKQLAVSLGS